MLGIGYFLFTPVIEIEQSGQRISFFNKNIIIDGQQGLLTIQGETIDLSGRMPHEFNGEEDLSRKGIKKISLQFSSIKASFQTSSNEVFSWKCKMSLESSNSLVQIKNDELEIDLGKSPLSDCQFFIPRNTQLSVKGVKGIVSILRPQYSLEFQFSSIEASLSLHQDSDYFFDTLIEYGQVDSFVSSRSPQAHQIKIFAHDGYVKFN